jgi:biotin synthase
LLTATNPDEDQDMKLIRKLGLKTQKVHQSLTDEEEGASLLKDVMTMDDEKYYQVI